MNRCLFCATLTITAFTGSAAAKELDGVYTPAQSPCPSPEEAIKKMKVPDGYEVRNFAAEPMVINPVAMTWDHRGRLWVVELYEYPSGAKKPNEYSKIATDENFRPVVKKEADSPRDRVIILEDTDNDGKADKRTVFAEGLNLATGILCGYDGVFVGQAPNLFFFRDTNGDDVADEYKTVLTGFGLEDRHELLNSFTWGPDGWLYMTHGVFTHSKVRRPEQKPEEGFKLDAGVFRIKISAPPSDTAGAADPHAHAYEVYADGTSNPWGVDFDARGNAFVSACVIDHLFHMAPGGLYQRQGGAPENPYAYELLPSIVSHKHFRAAYAGIQIYQGGIYPADTHGHVFIGNIHDNAVHEESLTPVGATFKAAPVRDFLRANDGWFRPVSTQTGPDGFLWIMDWCDKYPCYQNAQANPEGVDREYGRIWRVCYTGSEAGKKMAGMSREDKEMDLSKKSGESLLDLLTHPNSRISASATRQLAEKASLPVLENGISKKGLSLPLARALESASESPTRILFAQGKAPDVKDDDHVLLAWLAKVIGDYIPPGHRVVLGADGKMPDLKPLPEQTAMRATLKRLASNPHASVRRSVAVALRQRAGAPLTATRKDRPNVRIIETSDEWKLSSNAEALFLLIENSRQPEDKAIAFHIWQALEPQLSRHSQGMLSELSRIFLETKPLSHVLTYKTARRITDTRSGENMDLLLAFLDKLKEDDVLTAHALDGMLKAQEAGAVKPAKTDPAPFFARWAASKSADVRNHAGRLATLWGDKTAVAELIKLAEDPNTDAARRAEAIKTLRKLNSDEARAALLRILEKSAPQ